MSHSFDEDIGTLKIIVQVSHDFDVVEHFPNKTLFGGDCKILGKPHFV